MHLGHFWDEAWVYAPCARYMAQHGLSMLPDALPVELSRGHPLLFSFLAGVWMKIFGMSNESAHLFVISLSVILLGIIYWILRRLVGRMGALMSLTLIASQPIFIAMSASMFPEILLAIGLFIAISGFITNKKWILSLGLTVAVLTKESGLVFVAMFLIFDLIYVIQDKKRWRNLLAYLFPIGLFVGHTALLYLYHGWFFFPEHTDFVVFELNQISFKLYNILEFAFQGQNRKFLLFPILLVAPLLIKSRNSIRIIFTSVWVVLLLSVNYFSEHEFLVSTIWVTSSLLLILVLYKQEVIIGIDRLLILSASILLGFAVFSSLNFYTPRYLFPIVLLACLMVAIFVWNQRWFPKVFSLIVSILLISISAHSLLTERSVGELNLGLYDDLRLQGKMVDWMMENADRDDIVCTNFVTANYLTNEYSGYVNNDNFMICWFPNICDDCQDAEYVIYTRTTDCPGPETSSLVDYTLVYNDTLGASTVAIYHKPVIIPEF